jgi:peptidyl-prolyl cis-trans isomerase SurA
MKSTRFRATLLIITLFFVFTCPVQAVIMDRIVAIVNDTLITQSDLNNTFEPIRQKIEAQTTGAERETTLKKTQEAILNQMIDNILIEQQATKLGITVKDEEVTGTIRNILSQKNLTMNEFEKILDKEGMSIEAYKQDVKEQMTRSRVIRRELRTAISVSDEEIGEYYAQHRAEYESQMAVRIKQIVLFFPENADNDMKRKMKGDMEEILRRLKSGEPFAKLAAQFSQGPTAKDGGDIGFIERGIMNPEMEQVAFALEPGQVSGVIEFPAGLSIITVTDKRGGSTRMVESVRNEIKDKIMDTKMEKKYDEWIADLRQKAHITIKN